MTIARSMTEFTQQLSRGESISFGKLSISLEGIQIGDRQLSWLELEGIDVSYGDSAPPVVVVYQRAVRSHLKPEVWAMLSTNQVSDLPLLMLMLHEIGIETLIQSAS